MPIRVKCEGCKKTLSVKDHLAGKKIKCPVCQAVVSIPTPSSPSPDVEPNPSTPVAPTKKPAPVAKPAAKSNPGSQATAATKAQPKSKPDVEKPAANGQSKGNGTPTKAPPVEPAPLELPPENIEEEALAAFADEPPPPEELEPPKFIEFQCEWCDEKVKLPIDLAGKQAQCPNEECRRIVKVPLPKAPEKRDWKKMDKKGPSGAILNQPEQLENAWGTETASKAKQSSLQQAGAVEIPVTTRPRDIFDKARIGLIAVTVIGALGLAGYWGWTLVGAKQQQNTLKDLKNLVEGANPKVKRPSVLAGEAHRAIGLAYLHSKLRKPAEKAMAQLGSAHGAVNTKPTKADEVINEQIFLIDLALSQIELGGEGNELIGDERRPWADVRDMLGTTLQHVDSADLQVIALREVASRLFERKQPELAIGLVANFSAPVSGKRPLAYRQEVALIFARGDADALKKLEKAPDPKKDIKDGNLRVGYAEGYARKGDFTAADAFIDAPGGSSRDRLDAALGVAAIAVQLNNKDEANKNIKKALAVLEQKRGDVRPAEWQWQLLQLVKLAARADNPTIAKDVAKTLTPQFKLRAELEIFLAECDRSTSAVDVEKLAAIEEFLTQPAAKQPAGVGNTLSIAWLAVARQNTRLGHSREHSRQALASRSAAASLPEDLIERIRPAIEIGAALGAMK